MSQNILITGAAGGGSVVAEFISRKSGPIKKENIYAAVRSESHVQTLSNLGVKVVLFGLNDEAAIREAVLRNEIDVIVNTASAWDKEGMSYLLSALGERRKASGKQTYFIQSSVITMFSDKGGWPYGEVRDTDQLYEQEKQIGEFNPVRDTNIAIVEQAKALGVISINIPIPNVYGKGSGEFRKVSANIPAMIRSSIASKTVYKFDEDASPAATHISDLTALYALIVEKLLQDEPIPSGENGYYFAMAHRIRWWEICQHLAKGLYSRGLVNSPEVQTWPSYEMAAEHLGFPVQFIRAIGTATGQQIPVKGFQLGWQPKWDEKRFMESIDDEIKIALEFDTIKPSLFDALIQPKE